MENYQRLEKDNSKEKPKSELCAVEIKRQKYITCSKRYKKIKPNINNQALSSFLDVNKDISEDQIKKRNLETFFQGVVNYFEEESVKVKDDSFSNFLHKNE